LNRKQFYLTQKSTPFFFPDYTQSEDVAFNSNNVDIDCLWQSLAENRLWCKRRAIRHFLFSKYFPTVEQIPCDPNRQGVGDPDHMYTSTNPGQTQPSFWLAKLDSSGLQGVKKQVQALVSGVIASAM